MCAWVYTPMLTSWVCTEYFSLKVLFPELVLKIHSHNSKSYGTCFHYVHYYLISKRRFFPPFSLSSSGKLDKCQNM